MERMRAKQSHATRIARDVGAIALSVVVAVLLARSGLIGELLASVSGFSIIGGFVSGMFFVSVFTVAPAAAVLIELFQANSLFEVAIAAGLGGFVGDWVMFRFLRDRVAADLAFLARRSSLRGPLAFFRFRSVRWLTPLLGALIVASPLPDEAGLALMGFSGLRTAVFLPLSFALNFFGVLAIGIIVRVSGA